VLAAADRTRSRFRGFPRAHCGLFLVDHSDPERAVKRGGGRRPLSIAARDAECRYLLELFEALPDDRLFHRAWALTLLGRALDRLAADYAKSGRASLFERLQPVLIDGPDALP
jgi:RNA polymerase sigma-70 factor (ECF subfamily)